MIVINYITNIISNITLPELIMIILALALAYMAVEKEYEPLLLLPLAFGIMIANVSIAGLSSYDEGGLIYYLYRGIELGIYPPMIFICIGAMTDFSPLISSPKTALIGLGGQVGIFAAMFGALGLGYIISCFIPGFENFTMQEAAAIGVIGSSDGPTSIYITKQLASHLLPTITIAAYSYMALVPLIQPPVMRALTTQKERMVIMPAPKAVSRKKKILFPIVTTLLVLIFVPSAATLIAMLMLGNFIKESGVAKRLVRMLQGDLLNLLTLLIGLSIGGSATAGRVLNIGSQSFMQINRRKGKSSHWKCRSISNANGCQNISKTRSGIQSFQPSFNACNGTYCCKYHRFSNYSRNFYFHVWLTNCCYRRNC